MLLLHVKLKLNMILDREITIKVSSSVIIFKLKSIDISSKMNDSVTIPINKLWKSSNIEINVKCDICGSERKLQYNLYNKNIKKYNIYCCSNKCSHVKNKLTNLERYGDENYNNSNKRIETNLERYGVKNISEVPEFQEKTKRTKFKKYGDENYNNTIKRNATNLEKYGMTNTLFHPDFKEKAKKTNLEKYGCEDARSSDFVKNKRISTTLERYGVDFYTKTDEYCEKLKKTSLERYGVDNPNKSDEVKDKKIKSMIKKYGFISNSCTEESKRKLRETNLERYGFEYPMQVLDFFEKQQKNSKKINYYNEKLYYQSSYEKHFLDYMSELDLLNMVSRGFHIKYEFEGKERSHFPDFYIESYNLIVEVKSIYYFNKYLEKNNSKMNKCIELGYNYLFIINKNYKILNEILKNPPISE